MKYFRVRLYYAAVLMGMWLFVIVLRLLFFIGPGRAETVRCGEDAARQIGTLPAVRGKIIDSDGTVLAWSEAFFDLEVYPGKTLRPQTRKFLSAVLPHPLTTDSGILCRKLSGKEFALLQKNLHKYPELKLNYRVERCIAALPRLREVIGECQQENGVYCGISGLEKAYDPHLRGTPGAYEVLVDRYRNWIAPTLTIIRQAQNGRDLQLKQTAEELLQTESCHEVE